MHWVSGVDKRVRVLTLLWVGGVDRTDKQQCGALFLFLLHRQMTAQIMPAECVPMI